MTYGKIENDIPAEQYMAEADSWIPCSYENPRGSHLSEKQKKKRQKSTERLMKQTAESTRRYTLDKSCRIRQNREYRRIYARGKRFSNRAGLLYVTSAGKEPVRMGFVVTKRIGHAFARNRAKRLMKEVYRLHRHELKAGHEIILLASRFLTEVPYKEAEKALLSLWRKADLMETGQ